MATTSSQDGAKKKRKMQRPLIAPALPLNLKPRPAPTRAAAVPPELPAVNAPELTPVTEDTSATTLSVPPLAEPAAINNGSERGSDNPINEPAIPSQETYQERHPSSAAPEAIISHTYPASDDNNSRSRSVSPKASSHAALSSTQSPAPELVEPEIQVNGVVREALQSRSSHSLELASTQAELEVQPPAHFNHSVQANSTIMPRRYFSSEEPIFDWADEMSEEMPPDTLHIPSVPHLPELSSDSNVSNNTGSKITGDVPVRALPKPVFGFTAIPELQSDGVADDTLRPAANHLTNGHSHSSELKSENTIISTTPSKAERNLVPLVNGHARKASQALPKEPISDLTSHLAKLFETREFSDWSIHLVSFNSSYPPVAYPAHGVMISRSQVLRAHMRSRLQSRTMAPVITISPTRYVQPAAFEAALKYLYNEALLNPAECARYFTFEGTVSESTVKSYRLDFCFSYWLTGHLLGVVAVVEAGLELLYENLTWDTAELMIKAALDVRSSASHHTFPTSSDDPAFTPSTPDATGSPMSTRTRDTGAEKMVTQGIESIRVINVLTEALANGRLRIDLQDFRLDTSPPEILHSYLPDVQKYDKPHSTLASITFGSLPTAASNTSKIQSMSSQPVFFSSVPEQGEHDFSIAEKALSAILLSVPFLELSELFGGFMRSFAVEDVLALFEKILSERESRRYHVAESEWYKSEVALKRWIPEVDIEERLIRDGERSHLVLISHQFSENWG